MCVIHTVCYILCYDTVGCKVEEKWEVGKREEIILMYTLYYVYGIYSKLFGMIEVWVYECWNVYITA